MPLDEIADEFWHLLPWYKDRERTVIFAMNLDTYSVELFDDVAYVEGGKISQSVFPIDLRYRNRQVFSQRSFCGA